MERNMYVNYKLNDDKSLLTVTLMEEGKNWIRKIVKEYDLIKIDEFTMLYNQMLDDFNAEYDDELAEMLDELTRKLEKESE